MVQRLLFILFLIFTSVNLASATDEGSRIQHKIGFSPFLNFQQSPYYTIDQQDRSRSGVDGSKLNGRYSSWSPISFSYSISVRIGEIGRTKFFVEMPMELRGSIWNVKSNFSSEANSAVGYGNFTIPLVLSGSYLKNENSKYAVNYGVGIQSVSGPLYKPKNDQLKLDQKQAWTTALFSFGITSRDKITYDFRTSIGSSSGKLLFTGMSFNISFEI